MIKYEDIKNIDSARNTIEFTTRFDKHFRERVEDCLVMYEKQTVIELWDDNKVPALRAYLETIVSQCCRKLLDAAEGGIMDEVYADRYKKIKELDDLITYYLESV